MFDVHVKTLDGSSETFQIEDNGLTVADFKKKITEKMNIPIERQRLIFQGKVLIDDRILKDCGVASNTIHLVPRPPPQANSTSSASSSSSQIGHHERQRSSINTPNFMSYRQTMNSFLSAATHHRSDRTLSMQTDNNGSINMESNSPIAEVCDNHFRQLLHQTEHLLNSLDSVIHPDLATAFVSINTNGPAVSVPSSSNSTSQQTSPLNFQRLADMLSEQRRLWHVLGPYLDRWETMLRCEHNLRIRSSGSEVAFDASVSRPRTAATIIDSVSTHAEQDLTDTSACTLSINWSHELFNQVSALLHLHSHMLHLLSDFYVLPTSSSLNQPVADDAIGVPASASSSLATGIQVDTNPACESHQNRSLFINEPDSSVLYAHINIEPVMVAIARPVAGPPRGETERGVERRNHATNSSIADGENGDSETEPQDDSVHIPAAVRRTAHSAILRHIIDSMTPRVRLRSRASEQESEEETARAPHLRVRNPASLGDSQLSAAPFLPGLLPGHHGDHFLPCNSHHFSNSGVGALHLRARPRRSYVGSAADVGSTAPRRQSHSPAPPQERPVGARFASSSTILTGTARPPNQNVVRSMENANSGSLNRTIGDVAMQLTQILSHSVGPRFDTVSATTGSTSMEPCTLIANTSHRESVQFIPPSQIAVLESNASANTTPSGLSSRLTVLPGLLVEGLIRSMWSFIVELARSQLPSESIPNVDLDGWRSGANFPFISHSENLARLHPIMVSFVDGLRLFDLEAEETDCSSAIYRVVNLMNLDVQRMLEHNLVSHGSTVSPELVDLLLNNFPSDRAVDTIPESNIVAWGASRATSLGLAPLNFRRILHNFLTDGLSRHMLMWRDAGSHGDLGTALLNSLDTFIMELLDLSNFLVQCTVERLDLQLDSGPETDKTSIAMNFEPMMSMLRNFVNSLRGSGGEYEAAKLIQRGVDVVVRRHSTREGSGLVCSTENREQLESYLANSSDDVGISAKGSDCSDVYMGPDAVAATRFPSAVASSSTRKSNNHNASVQRVTGAEPMSPSAPNSLSEWRTPSDDCSLPPFSTSEAFPPGWTTLVASDVAQLVAVSSAAATTTTENEEEANLEELEEEEVDAPTTVRRLSDSYIAGMPSKRRRLMLKKKKSLVCPANQLFLNLLKEAMSLTSQAGRTLEVASTEDDDTASQLKQPPQHVSEAFKAYICDQLSHRLSTNPSFDAQRHPAASEAFSKRPRDAI